MSKPDQVVFSDLVHVSQPAYAYMASLNILYVLSAFTRSLQWYTPPKAHMDLQYLEVANASQLLVSVNYVVLFVETMPAPCKRDMVLNEVFRVAQSDGKWLVSLRSEIDGVEL